MIWLELCNTYSSSCHHHFHRWLQWNSLTQVHLEKWPLNGERERDMALAWVGGHGLHCVVLVEMSDAGAWLCDRLREAQVATRQVLSVDADAWHSTDKLCRGRDHGPAAAFPCYSSATRVQLWVNQSCHAGHHLVCIWVLLCVHSVKGRWTTVMTLGQRQFCGISRVVDVSIMDFIGAKDGEGGGDSWSY